MAETFSDVQTVAVTKYSYSIQVISTKNSSFVDFSSDKDLTVSKNGDGFYLSTAFDTLVDAIKSFVEKSKVKNISTLRAFNLPCKDKDVTAAGVLGIYDENFIATGFFSKSVTEMKITISALDIKELGAALGETLKK